MCTMFGTTLNAHRTLSVGLQTVFCQIKSLRNSSKRTAWESELTGQGRRMVFSEYINFLVYALFMAEKC